MFCGKCGSQVNDGAFFCANCGSSLSDQPSAQAAQPAPKKTVAVRVRAQNTVDEQFAGGQSVNANPMNGQQMYDQTMNANPMGGQQMYDRTRNANSMDDQQMYGQPMNANSMGGQQMYGQTMNGYPTGGFPTEMPKKKSKAPIVIVVILVVLILAAAGIGAYYFLYADNDKDGGEERVSVSSQLKTSNSNAKMAYNLVAEYMADMIAAEAMTDTETQAVPYKKRISEISKYYDISEDGEGLQHKLYILFSDSGVDEGWVYIGSAEIDGNETFFVQYWEDDDSEVIGQYPNAIEKENVGSVEYGKYFAP